MRIAWCVVPHRLCCCHPPLRARLCIVSADEGARLYVDGVLLLSTPVGAASPAQATVAGQVVLAAGTTHVLALEYFNGWGVSWLTLELSVDGAAATTVGPSMVRAANPLRGVCFFCFVHTPPRPPSPALMRSIVWVSVWFFFGAIEPSVVLASA